MQKILRKYYGVKNKKRGRRRKLLFTPRRFRDDSYFEISARTLAMIDSAIENFKRGIVSGSVGLSEFRD